MSDKEPLPVERDTVDQGDLAFYVLVGLFVVAIGTTVGYIRRLLEGEGFSDK